MFGLKKKLNAAECEITRLKGICEGLEKKICAAEEKLAELSLLSSVVEELQKKKISDRTTEEEVVTFGQVIGEYFADEDE